MLVGLVAFALVACNLILAIPTIEVKGSKFFTSDGNQFFIKGVAYILNLNVNGIVDGAQCKIDAPLIQKLGANVVRVYSVDPTLNHDECMQAFEDAGIYVLIDMSTPTYSIDRVNPKWTTELRNAFAQVVDGFQGYDNVLGFFAGTEIINNQSTSVVAPYAKAVVADMKAYRDLKQYRKIPIGYSAADLSSIRAAQQNYFACGDDKTAVDFYGFTTFTWCGDSSYTVSGYDQLYNISANYSVPIFISETGCNVVDGGNRTWSDQVAVLGRQMNDRFSGNVIYEWAQDQADYGLVQYSNSQSAAGTPTPRGDYSRLQSQWATLSPTGVKASAYNPTLTRPSCPAFTSSIWLVQASATLPTLGTSGLQGPASSGASTGGTATRTNAASTASGASGNGTNASHNAPVGAIVGGVVGGIAAVVLVVVALLFFRRRRRSSRSRQGQEPRPNHEVAPEDEEEKRRVHGWSHPELAGDGLTEAPGNGPEQELDPRRGQIAPMPAPELEHAGRPVEGDADGGRRYNEHEEMEHYDSEDVSAYRQTQATGPSPYVEAQRRMEMDWLESEEARLRQQREVLMRQHDRSERRGSERILSEREGGSSYR